MLFSFTSRIISALAAFLYPGYASYKTLSQRPASEAELERWLKYWSVLGCIVGVEYLAEWLISWIPLYTTIKAIFLLYLALPQTQGATYVYNVYLRPFFASHEQQIDMAIAEVRGRAYRFLQEKARAVWAALLGALSPGGEGANAAGGPIGGRGPQDPPPTLNNPAAGPAQLLSSLWTSFGPGIVAGGAALLRQTAASTLPSGVTGTPAVDPAERRRQLEAELASLPPSSSSIPMPSANNPARHPSASSLTPSSSGSSSGVRERTMSGKFEEIKGGDVEGYDVDDDFERGFPAGGSTAPKNTRGTSWFGGWGPGGSSGKGSYERVKDE